MLGNILNSKTINKMHKNHKKYGTEYIVKGRWYTYKICIKKPGVTLLPLSWEHPHPVTPVFCFSAHVHQ